MCCRWECAKETSIEAFIQRPNVWAFTNEVEVDCDIAAVFKILEDGEKWPQWYPKMRKVVWTSPDPKNVGSTRTAQLGSLFGNIQYPIYHKGL